ncbi:MAG: hypothetical protein AABX70_03535 [Nanoarchaeota archaeon]
MEVISWHHLLHFVTAALSLSLFGLASLVYQRNKNRKFLFICAAFLIFAIKEVVLAMNIIVWGSASVEVFTHALSLVILVLFALGILR